MKKVKTVIQHSLLTALVMCLFTVPVQAFSEVPEDGSYYLTDESTNTILPSAYDSYTEALSAFQREAENYDNLLVVQNNKVIKAEYGLIRIKETEGCDYNVNFRLDGTNDSGYTNGCYGKDALYLDTDSRGENVLFLLSGAKGWMSLEDCEIIPEKEALKMCSSWTVSGECLRHHIQLGSDWGVYDIELGSAGSLKDGTYFSYDGHYFYAADQFREMSDDLRNNTHLACVNPQDPYFCYYQYLSHRTVSAYSWKEFEQLFHDHFGIDHAMDSYRDRNHDSADDTLNRSQFYGSLPYFWQYQYAYGANAMMMLALSTNEAAYGRSWLAYQRNNLFGHAAYDSAVEENASLYRTAGRSVLSHARHYISEMYCNPNSFTCHGGYFGNKAGGMNVSYASDPYWGEKAAAYCREYDDLLGGKDKESYTLGIALHTSSIPVYREPDTASAVLYHTPSVSEYAFVLLGEVSGFYRVQSEAAASENYNYRTDIGYIEKTNIDLVKEGTLNVNEIQYHTITFDAGEGVFEDGENVIRLMVKDGDIPVVNDPQKEHFLFTGWNSDIDRVTKDTAYYAVYEEIEKASLTSLPKTEYVQDEKIDLSGGVAQVVLKDGETRSFPLTTGMVSGYDSSLTGSQTIAVRVGGEVLSYEIHVKEKPVKNDEALLKTIREMIALYRNLKTFYKNDVDSILDIKKKIDENDGADFTAAEVSLLDEILRKAFGNNISFSMTKDSLETGVSGILLNDRMENVTERNLFLRNAYHIRTETTCDEKLLQKVRTIANARYAEVITPLSIRITKNYQTWENPRGFLVFTVNKPDDDAAGDLYEVVFVDRDGDVLLCPTEENSTRIRFTAEEAGQFVLLRRSKKGLSSGETYRDTLTYENTKEEQWKAVVIPGICALIIFASMIFVSVLKGRRRKKKT